MTADWSSCRERLEAGLGLMQLELPAEAREKLLAYLQLLSKWNKAYNLTAVREPLEMVSRHLLDSLSILPCVGAGPLADLGTGAGLPGIPLAIVRPELSVTLVDSNGKKTRFLHQAVLELGLSNAKVLQQRLEVGPPATAFAQVSARACASLAELWTLAEPWLELDGELLAMKGTLTTLEEEMAALPNAPIRVSPVTIPFLGQEERHLVRIRRP